MKKGEVLLVVSLVFFMLVSVSLVNAECPLNLVGYWKLDESSGTIIIDSSCNGYDGSCSGTTCPTSVSGKLGNAYSLYANYLMALLREY